MEELLEPCSLHGSHLGGERETTEREPNDAAKGARNLGIAYNSYRSYNGS
jgi:hypothetical protein